MVFWIRCQLIYCVGNIKTDAELVLPKHCILFFSIGSYCIKNLNHHFNIWIQTTHLKINLFPRGDGVKQIKWNGLGGLSEYHICPIVHTTNKINEWKKMFYMTVHVCVSWVLMAKTGSFSWKLASLFVFSAFGIINTVAFGTWVTK